MAEKDEKRVVVLMPADMVKFLEDRAQSIGVGNVSALLRMMIRQEMNDTELRGMKAPANA